MVALAQVSGQPQGLELNQRAASGRLGAQGWAAC